MKSAIECRNVWKEYENGRVVALKNINLRVGKGETVAVLGPSGSGKSTLMHIMGCLDKPTRGKVLLNGVDVSKLTDAELAKIRGRTIGFVFQFFYLIPSITALENVMLPMVFSGKRDRKRALELLELMGLGDRVDHLPLELSGGERQRVAIARALANDPEIILADEPTGNLDSKTGREIMKILLELNRKFGKTIVMVTHDNSLAKKMKRIIRIKDGRIVGGEGK